MNETFTRPMDMSLAQARKALEAELPQTSRIASIDIDLERKEIVAKVVHAAPGDMPPPPGGPGPGAPDLGPGPDMGGDIPPPPHAPHRSKEDEILDLLHQIADKVGIGGKKDGDGDEDGAGPMGEADLGDGGDDVPTPVAEPKKDDGVFASLAERVAGRDSFVVDRADARGMLDGDIAAEVTAGFPGCKVARIVRSEDLTIARVKLVRA